MICLASFKWFPWITCLQFNRKVLICLQLLNLIASLLRRSSRFVYMLAYITQCFRVLAFTKCHALIIAEHPNRVATFNTVPFQKAEAMIRWKVQGYLRDSERGRRPGEERAEEHRSQELPWVPAQVGKGRELHLQGTAALGQALQPTLLGSHSSSGLLPCRPPSWGALCSVCPPSDASFVLRFGNCQCTSPFLNTEDVEIGDEERFSLCSVISSRSPLTVSSWLLTSVTPVVSNSPVLGSRIPCLFLLTNNIETHFFSECTAGLSVKVEAQI